MGTRVAPAPGVGAAEVAAGSLCFCEGVLTAPRVPGIILR